MNRPPNCPKPQEESCTTCRGYLYHYCPLNERYLIERGEQMNTRSSNRMPVDMREKK